MDQLPDRAKLRIDHCDVHGAFEARNFAGRHWTRCPSCIELAAAERAEAERVAAAQAAEHRRQRTLDAARIPERFRGCSFAGFVATTDNQRSAVTIARDYVERFDEVSARGAGLVFAGKPGTGKTHLATAILQGVPSPNVQYWPWSRLRQAVRDTWRRDGDRSELQLCTTLERLDLLVIDELGAKSETDNEQAILFDLIDARYSERRPTILLTNQDRAGFISFVGERTFDRLRETCRWVAFDWDSYRPTARKAAASALPGSGEQ